MTYLHKYIKVAAIWFIHCLYQLIRSLDTKRRWNISRNLHTLIHINGDLTSHKQGGSVYKLYIMATAHDKYVPYPQFLWISLTVFADLLAWRWRFWLLWLLVCYLSSIPRSHVLYLWNAYMESGCVRKKLIWWILGSSYVITKKVRITIPLRGVKDANRQY